MKILILAKDFKPSNLIAAQRPNAWYKYLKKSGHQVTVITSTSASKIEDEDIIRVQTDLDFSQSILGKLRSKTRSFFELWLPFIYPKLSRYAPILKAAKKKIESQRPDIIIATGEPYILFGFANILSQNYGINWVADYRDVWTRNPLLKEQSILIRLLNKHIYCSAEQLWVRNAALITTASQFYKSILEKTIPNSNIKVILNGHDIDFPVEKVSFNSSYTIAYSGRLYPFQPFEIVAETLEELSNDGHQFKLIFFGLSHWPDQELRVKKVTRKIAGHIEYRNTVAYHIYIQQLAQVNLFLLLSNKNNKQLVAKIFDYAAFDKKIMLYPEDEGELQTITTVHPGGIVCKSQPEMKAFLENEMTKFSKNPVVGGQTIDINQTYSRVHTTKILERELLKIIDQSENGRKAETFIS